MNLGGHQIQHTIIHCASKMLMAITATNSAMTDMAPHFVLVARVVVMVTHPIPLRCSIQYFLLFRARVLR